MTSIADFYAGRSIFITGVTGFMGKVLLEKLLRSCPAIKCVYVLVRPKKGQEPHERIKAIISSKLFNKVRESTPNLEEMIIPVCGDILHEGLGITDSDLARMLPEVSVVFHSAATVRFDEVMKLSVQMNVVGVQQLIAICKQMPKLEVLVHVSTAYANCDRTEIQEAIYPPPLHPKKLMDAVDWMPEDVIEDLTPMLIKKRPNTYTYTKAMAEYLLQEEAGDLPVAIVRPSIVGASWQEPVAGWVDNFNGPTGLLAAIGKGLLRSMLGKVGATADMVPVDLATNLMIVVGWYTALERPENFKVYNGTTGQINGIAWGQVERAAYKYLMKHPLDGVIRVPNPRFTMNRMWHALNVWFDHYLPCWILDLYLRLCGKKAFLVRLQKRIRRSVASLEFFTTRQWHFHNENVYMLQSKLSEQDKEEFNFDPKSMDWPTYLENYCLGAKEYALKEDMSKLPECRKAMQRLQRINYVIYFFLSLLLLKFLSKRVGVARNLWQFLASFAVSLLNKIPSFAKA